MTKRSRRCQITGKSGLVGNNVSHSNRRTKRVQEANLQWKRFFIEEKNSWVRLFVSTSVIRTISKKGLLPVLKKHGCEGLVR